MVEVQEVLQEDLTLQAGWPGLALVQWPHWIQPQKRVPVDEKIADPVLQVLEGGGVDFSHLSLFFPLPLDSSELGVAF